MILDPSRIQINKAHAAFYQVFGNKIMIRMILQKINGTN